MVEKWGIAIPELTGEEERGVYVYLPDSYFREPDRRYPVLYMFDGHNVFFDSDATYGKCWGMKEYMDFTETPLIIAAVECNHSPDHGRLREYTPFPFSEPSIGKIDARGKVTMDWLCGTFKSEIDRRYRTLPDREHTFLAGSSMGGLMSLYGITVYNRCYSRAAALSPSLWVSPDRIARMIGSAKLLPGTVVYLDFGEEELKGRPSMLREFQRTVSLLLDRGIPVHSRIVPGGTHCEASWERQIPFFMETLLY